MASMYLKESKVKRSLTITIRKTLLTPEDYATDLSPARQPSWMSKVTKQIQSLMSQNALEGVPIGNTVLWKRIFANFTSR